MKKCSTRGVTDRTSDSLSPSCMRLPRQLREVWALLMKVPLLEQSSSLAPAHLQTLCSVAYLELFSPNKGIMPEIYKDTAFP